MASVSPAVVRELALAAGFDLVRFGPVDPGADGDRFLAWLDAGRAGEMHYLERNRQRIRHPKTWLPAARSGIALAYDYGSQPTTLRDGARIARYARGRDYHRFLLRAARGLQQRLEAEGVPRGTMRAGTDAVPILERALAGQSGIGFLAKSAGIIHPRLGPYLLLAELLTPLELPFDGPSPGSCGTCTACLQACPTGAITAPHQVDARRCLSYTTIELRGFVPEQLRTAQGEWLFGCDVCLEVCPFTRRAQPQDRPELRPHQVVATYDLVGVLQIDAQQWHEEWTGTPMRRATRSGMRRNAAIVLGNRRRDDAAPALRQALDDEDPILRGHAAWALGRIGGQRPALDARLAREPDERVRQELDRALQERS